LFTQEYAAELAQEHELVFICGRYEGIDQRIIDLYVDDEICIGDYVISSGEVAAVVIIDAVYRLIDGVISERSLDEESFSDGLLEYPHYTRPAEYCGITVPDILLSGHHAQIESWRLQQRVRKTLHNRPDLAEAARMQPQLRHLFDAVQEDDIKAKG
jgi:tRNA (guanine37-N1)-methyltransferase